MQKSVCRFRDGKHCRIISAIDKRNPVIPETFCQTTCNAAVDTWKLVFFNRFFKLQYPTFDALLKDIETGVEIKWSPTVVGHAGQPCSTCGQVKNIVKGFSKLVWERITRGKPDNQTIKRAEKCATCEHRTFLSVQQWAINTVQRKSLPVNHEPGDWDALWCAICKCCLEAKIRVVEEKCPLNKW